MKNTIFILVIVLAFCLGALIGFKTPKCEMTYDLNGDNKVDLTDVSILIANLEKE